MRRSLHGIAHRWFTVVCHIPVGKRGIWSPNYRIQNRSHVQFLARKRDTIAPMQVKFDVENAGIGSVSHTRFPADR